MVGLVAAINWDNLSYATSFLLGATLATVATLRVVRHVTAFFSKVERQRSDDDPPPP